MLSIIVGEVDVQLSENRVNQEAKRFLPELINWHILSINVNQSKCNLSSTQGVIYVCGFERQEELTETSPLTPL